MTDEQRTRFEEWQATRPWAVTESAYDLDLADWLTRDAAVQALWGVLPTVETHQSVLRDVGEDALAALAGESGDSG